MMTEIIQGQCVYIFWQLFWDCIFFRTKPEARQEPKKQPGSFLSRLLKYSTRILGPHHSLILVARGHLWVQWNTLNFYLVWERDVPKVWYSLYMQLPFIKPQILKHLHFSNWNHRAAFPGQSGTVPVLNCQVHVSICDSWAQLLE